MLQFGLDRDIDGAARDVQAAINAARADLPTSLRSNPTYRKVNPADAPILILALTSKTLTRGQIYDAATNVLAQTLSQIDGIGQVIIGGAALPAVRVELNPHGAVQIRHRAGGRARRAGLRQRQQPEGRDRGRRPALPDLHQRPGDRTRRTTSRWSSPTATAPPVRLSDVADVEDSVENLRNAGLANGKPAVLVILFRQPGANIIDTVDSVKAALPQLKAAMPTRHRPDDRQRPHHHHPRLAARHRDDAADRGRAW